MMAKRFFLVFMAIAVGQASNAGPAVSRAPAGVSAEADQAMRDAAAPVADASINPADLPQVDFAETPKAQLAEYMPSRFENMLTKMKNGPAMRTLSRFPMESFMFFLAVGAVTAVQLNLDYSSNPMRMQEHIEHSLSPLGMFSFYAFMYTNNVTTNLLMTSMKSKWGRPAIPYIGMTAGFYVQNLISTFAADPNVLTCVKSLFKTPGKAVGGQPGESACDVAFSAYVLKKKFADTVPALASMLVSTAAATALQQATILGVRYAALRLIGLEVGLMVVPGGAVVRGLGFAAKHLTQIALFYGLDVMFFNRIATDAWKNSWDGSRLAAMETEVARGIAHKKSAKWANELPANSCTTLQKNTRDCTRDFVWQVKETNTQMAEWRLFNLMDVYTAHQGWAKKIEGLMGSYRATHDFYQEFVSQARNMRWKNDGPLKLDLNLAFYGVYGPEWTAEKRSLWARKPLQAQTQASDYLREVAQRMNTIVGTAAQEAGFNVNADVQALTDSIAKFFASEDFKVQAQGIALINSKIEENRLRPGGAKTFREKAVLAAIKKEIGAEAEAFPGAGRSFVKSYEQFSENNESLAQVSVPRISGGFNKISAPEHLLIQMLCGPDADKQSVIDNRELKLGVTIASFPAAFRAPRIVKDDVRLNARVKSARNGETMPVCAYGALDSKEMYTSPVTYDGKEYKNLVDVIQANLLETIVGVEEPLQTEDADPTLGATSGEDQTFNVWWAHRAETPLLKAFDAYQTQYVSIVEQLVNTLFRKGDAKMNWGNVSNGVIEALRQEYRLQLLLLGEMYKDLSETATQAPVSAAQFGDRAEGSLPISTDNQPNLFKTLRWGSWNGQGVMSPVETSVLEWNTIASAAPKFNGFNAMTAKRYGRALKFQRALEYEIENMIYLLSIAYTGREEHLTAKAVESAEKINEILKALPQAFVLKDPKTGADVNLIQNPEQKALLEVTSQSLQSVASELSSYISMIYAVSPSQIKKSKEAFAAHQSATAKAYQEQVEHRLKTHAQ